MIVPQTTTIVKPKDVNSSKVKGFLKFLAKDMKNNPGHLELIDKKLVSKIESLVGSNY
jgi:hypothetical protein